ncbi:hypothetical protein ACWIE6_24775 [Paenibacillus taichungensis]|uniref:hypothetical protein n=1 Tax=Paenibacillus taichungensis TaxID=484184 RepID=UPI0028721786|nr:hypothetical protein [Paenibacillus taichungensis]MDR9748738.1 hypothetical protein [Paenibacillus taichungensis]
MVEQTRQQLQELGAYEVPNPTVYKAIAMRRLLDQGVNESEAKQSVDEEMNSHQ